MGVAEKIKVRGFSNEYHRAIINIGVTNSWLSNLLEKRANKYDITLQQFNVLRILRGQFPNAASNTLVKERMINSMPDISRLVNRIEMKGLISKCTNEKDRRGVELRITDKGLELLQELEEDMLLADVIAPNLTEEEAGQLSNLLDKLRGQDN